MVLPKEANKFEVHEYADDLYAEAEGILADETEKFIGRISHDPAAPAISLHWDEVATLVFNRLCKEGIDPNSLTDQQVDVLMKSAKNALEWGTGDGFWETTIDAGLSVYEIKQIEAENIDIEDAHLEAQHEERTEYFADDDVYGGMYSEE